MRTTETKGTALVTGASSGIGAIYADRLAQRGYDLILVARNESRLAFLARRLARDTGRAVETMAADLTNAADLQRVEQILRTNADISLLVNNAGVGAAGALLASDVNKMEAMIHLNVTALMRLTYATVPGFVDRGTGTIINISSGVAIVPETLNGVYGGTKAFVLALTHSLVHELAERRRQKGQRAQAPRAGRHRRAWHRARTASGEHPGSRRWRTASASLAAHLSVHSRVFADGGDAGEKVAKATVIAVEIVRKNPDQVGFAVNPRRWVVERFFAWIGRNRRLAKDFEATIDSARAFLYAASVMLLVRRIARAS
jgi:short-subunit dehydrogenase